MTYGAQNCMVLLHHQPAEDSSSNPDWRENSSSSEGGRDYPRVVIQTDAAGERAKVIAVCWCPVEETSVTEPGVWS